MENINHIRQSKVAARAAVLTCALLAFSCLSQAELKFDQTVIEDVIMPGEQSYPFEFSFKNTGDSTVEISEVKTSCGCTTAKLEKMIYAAGESGVITGRFSVGDRQGLQQKSINVLTKDLGQPDIRLALKLEIPQLATMKPGLLLWRVGAELTSKTLKISPNADLGVEIVSIESDSENFVLESEKSQSEKGAYEVSVLPVTLDVSARALIKVQLATKGDASVSRTVYAHAVIR
jgi:hypothetical protein